MTRKNSKVPMSSNIDGRKINNDKDTAARSMLHALAPPCGLMGLSLNSHKSWFLVERFLVN
jgi:hypothetical protein